MNTPDSKPEKREASSSNRALSGLKVLIIDDFLASGATILGLVRLTQAAGASIVGIGTLIEKTFEGGREALQYLKVPIEALVQITSMEDGKIIFAP